MHENGFKDIAAGLLIGAIGAFFALYALRWNMGSVTRMGPGYLPVVLGSSLAALGLLILIKGLRERSVIPRVRWRSALFVLTSILAFATTLRFGLVPATVIAVIIASFADPTIRNIERVLMAIAIAFFTVLVFRVGLGMRIPLWWV